MQVGPPHDWHARGDSSLAVLDWRTEGYEQFYVSCHRYQPRTWGVGWGRRPGSESGAGPGE